jgi:hypothetical protein
MKIIEINKRRLKEDFFMNDKNIGLFDYVYSSMFESEKNDELKWKEFEEICSEKMNYFPYDFIIFLIGI